jgi:hypothetical protein
MAAVRRSCQTMARWIALPVARSHTTVVSRWLVMPMARCLSLQVGLLQRVAAGHHGGGQTSSGPCSPSRRPESAAGFLLRDGRNRMSGRNTMAREEVVP